MSGNMCDCADCAFRGMQLCEHRKLLDEVNRLKGTIVEARDRISYYFGSSYGAGFSDPQIQNVYDVLCRDDIKERKNDTQ